MLISLDVSVFRINCVSADTGSHRSCVCVPTHLHVNGVLQGFSLIFNSRKDWLIEIYLKRVYLPLGLGTIDYDSWGTLHAHVSKLDFNTWAWQHWRDELIKEVNGLHWSFSCWSPYTGAGPSRSRGGGFPAAQWEALISVEWSDPRVKLFVGQLYPPKRWVKNVEMTVCNNPSQLPSLIPPTKLEILMWMSDLSLNAVRWILDALFWHLWHSKLLIPLLLGRDISISALCGVLLTAPLQKCWEVLLKHNGCCSGSTCSENCPQAGNILMAQFISCHLCQHHQSSNWSWRSGFQWGNNILGEWWSLFGRGTGCVFLLLIFCSRFQPAAAELLWAAPSEVLRF